MRVDHIKALLCQLPGCVGIPPLVHPPGALEGLRHAMVVRPLGGVFNALRKDMHLMALTQGLDQGHGVALSTSRRGRKVSGQDSDF